MIRILLIDDHPLLRRGVTQLIGDDPELSLAGEAGSGAEGIELARREQPDLILLDLNMTGMDGFETLSALAREELHAIVLVLTVSDQPAHVNAALEAGAQGYLLKDMEPDELLEALKRCARGESVISDGARHAAEGADATERLTEREGQILRALARGRSNKEIARDLALADGTVKVHLRNILRKLGFRSRVEAALWAADQGYR